MAFERSQFLRRESVAEIRPCASPRSPRPGGRIGVHDNHGAPVAPNSEVGVSHAFDVDRHVKLRSREGDARPAPTLSRPPIPSQARLGCERPPTLSRPQTSSQAVPLTASETSPQNPARTSISLAATIQEAFSCRTADVSRAEATMVPQWSFRSKQARRTRSVSSTSSGWRVWPGRLMLRERSSGPGLAGRLSVRRVSV